MSDSISLNKFISDTGYCSRREADRLIETGRVLLNDRVARLGNRYTPGDTVEVDGSIITGTKKEKKIYLVLNKPVGITSTTEEHVPGNIVSFVNHSKRIFPIGRLDKDSEGLIFLTNDGDIINKILRAGNSHEKEYVVKVNKPITPAFIQKMSQGVPVLDTVTLPCKVQSMGRQTFRITLTQGLNRQIRRMCEYLDYVVVSLQRVRIMNIKLDKLALGKWRYLSETEVESLKEAVADSSKTAPVQKKARKSGSEPTKIEKKEFKKEGKPENKKEFKKDEKPAKKTFNKEGKTDKGPKANTSGATKKEAPKKNSYKAFREKGRKR